jgi:hypothetical protein
MAGFSERVLLGRSGLWVSRLGLGSSFGAPSSAYLDAFERGVNYFYWGSLRGQAMRDAIREIARGRRDDLAWMRRVGDHIYTRGRASRIIEG